MIPISGTIIPGKYFFNKETNLEHKLQNSFSREKAILYGRGSEAIYALLKVLKDEKGKDEVIIPAYTADTVYLAAIQAGCRVKLCDMSLESFNMDLDHLDKLVTTKTLAVVMVHLFGIPENIDRVTDICKRNEVFLIDDSCQSLGSKFRGKYTSFYGDASVLSFSKGKNLSAVEGGALLLDDQALEERLIRSQGNVVHSGVYGNLRSVLEICAIGLLNNPFLYGLTYKLHSYLRKCRPPEEFVLQGMPTNRKKLLCYLSDHKEKNLDPRHDLGREFCLGLKDMEGIAIPEIDEKSSVVWNRFPVLFEKTETLERVQKQLLAKKIEANRFYEKLVFEGYDEQFSRDEYKVSAYFAEHLLTLPCNPYLNIKNLRKIIECFQKEI